MKKNTAKHFFHTTIMDRLVFGFLGKLFQRNHIIIVMVLFSKGSVNTKTFFEAPFS